MIMLKTTRTNLSKVIDDFFNDNFLDADGYEMEQPDQDFHKIGNQGLGSYRSNLLEDNDSYMLEMQTPGLTKKDISITVENGFIVVRSIPEDKFKMDNKTYIRREFYNTEIELDYRLADNVDIDNIKAKVENGILSIEIPKLIKNSNNKKQIKIS